MTPFIRLHPADDVLIARIKWWEHYTEINEGEMNNNPSPGNKAGGLTTILEKSLGAVAKGGTSNLEAVYEYAEPVRPWLCLHGYAGLRPRQCHRPGRGRGKLDLLYLRPRLGLRLRAIAITQAGDQHGVVAAPGRRHGHQLAARSSTAVCRCKRWVNGFLIGCWRRHRGRKARVSNMAMGKTNLCHGRLGQ